MTTLSKLGLAAVEVQNRVARHGCFLAGMAENSRRSPLFVESPVGILILDRQGDVTDVNPVGCKDLSRKKDRLVGQRFLEWVLSGDRSRSEEELDREENLGIGIPRGHSRSSTSLTFRASA